jgi:Na+/melibiose symporter-like transporter
METNRLSQLMTLTCGGHLSLSRAHETMLAVLAIGAALALSALWGIAAGSASATLAIANAYKVPMVILLSAITALPAGLVALRLTNARLTATELASAFAFAIFGGTLVLATLAPLVAIYYHTSSKAGVPLALGSVFVALATATLLFGRAVARRVLEHTGSETSGRAASLLAVVVLVALFVAALLQYVAVASPIIGDVTRFDGGFDSFFAR